MVHMKIGREGARVSPFRPDHRPSGGKSRLRFSIILFLIVAIGFAVVPLVVSVDTTSVNASGTIDDLSTIESAISGDTSTFSLTGDLSVGEDFVIPEGFTLNAGEHCVKVECGVTLTVNGTISQSGDKGVVLVSSGTEGRITGLVIGVPGTVTTGTEGLKAYEGTRAVNNGTLNLNSGAEDGKASVIFGDFYNDGQLNLSGTTDSKLIIGSYEGSPAVSSKTIFKNSGTINARDTKIIVNEGSSLINSGSICSELGSGSAGSADITGAGEYENQGGSVGIPVNTAIIEGADSTMSISGTTSGRNIYPSLQTMTVPEEKTLCLTDVAHIGVNGELFIHGDLEISGKLVISSLLDGAKPAKIVVNGRVTIKDGGQLQIGGTDDDAGLAGEGILIVSESGSIDVQKGGKLSLVDGKDSDISGTLTAEEGSELSVYKDDSAMTVSGSADISGYIDGDSEIINKGNLTIDNGSNDIRDDVGARAGKVTVWMASSNATLDVDSFFMEKGADTTLTVTDSGLCTYKNSSSETSVSDTNSNSITFGFTDDASSTVNADKVVMDGPISLKQSASSRNVGVYGETKRSQNHTIDVSGSVSGSFTYLTGSTPSSGDRLTVDMKAGGTEYFSSSDIASDVAGINISGKLILGDGVTATADSQSGKDGKVSVTGFIVDGGSGTSRIAVTGEGSLDVTGEIVTPATVQITSGGEVNAALYITRAGTGSDMRTEYRYTTLEKAIDGIQSSAGSVQTTVQIIDTVTLTEDTVLPSNVKLMFLNSSSHVNVGSPDSRAKLTVECELRTIGRGQIDVDGTLVFTDKSKDKTYGIGADVMFESDDKNGSRTYTNIHSALEEAGKSSGPMTIEITRDPFDGKVKIERNQTIPSNVTLVLGDEAHTAGLELADGVTLTVDGTLKISQDIVASSRFAVNSVNIEGSSADTTCKSSAVVVNGKLMVAASLGLNVGSGNASGYETSLVASAPICGSYYDIEGWHVISTLDEALIETDVTSDCISVYGPVVCSDATFTPNDCCTRIDVMEVYDENDETFGFIPAGSSSAIRTTLKMNSLALKDGAMLTINRHAEFTGTVCSGEDVVSIVGVSSPGGPESSYSIAGTDDGLSVFGDVSIDEEGKSFIITGGNVSLGYSSGNQMKILEVSGYQPFTIASGAIATASGIGNLLYLLDVDGTLTIPSGTDVVALQMLVDGSVDVAESTPASIGGTFTIVSGYVGISDDFQSSTPASVAGPMNVLSKLVVSASSSVDQDLSALRSTELHLNGTPWFSMYAISAYQIHLDGAPLTNAVLLGWSETEGGKPIEYDNLDPKCFEVGVYDKLYAVVKADIYRIVVKADQGIDDMYLDGHIMSKGKIAENGFIYDAFWLNVSAGEYEVTCKLANGYTGVPILSDSRGETVDGNRFSISGNPKAGETEVTVEYQLSGIQASGYAPVVDVDNDDLTPKDHLLIVLIILTLLVAIVVASGFPRS